MQTDKPSIKTFEDDFVGLDFRTSDLKKGTAFFKAAENVAFFETPGAQKREGMTIAGGVGLNLGIDNYVYLDRTTGETMEEMIGFGSHVFRWTPATVTFTRTSGTYTVIVTRSGETITLTFFNGATNDLVYSYSEADTSKNYPTGTIGDLARLLVATGLYTITLSHPGSVITTAVTGSIGGTNLTIQTAIGNFNVGDKHTFYNYFSGFLEYPTITSKASASQITHKRLRSYTTKANQPIGSCTGEILSDDIYITTPSVAAAAHTLSYFFWDGIPYGGDAISSDSAAFARAAGCLEEVTHVEAVLNQTITTLPHIYGVNANDKFYFGYPYFLTLLNPDEMLEITPDGQLFCYDREAVYRAGPMRPQTMGAAGVNIPATLSPSTAGDWDYMFTFIYVDSNGVEWESVPSDYVNNNTGGTGAGTTITIDPLQINALSPGLRFFDVRGARVTVNAVATATITVAGDVTGFPTLRVGDEVLLAYSTDLQDKYTVIATQYETAPFTITLDTAVTINSGSIISTGLGVRIYRTEKFGNIFYKVTEKLIYKQQVVSYVDTIADTALAIEYIEPVAGQEHEPSPIVGKLTTHQGCLVSFGSTREPNTVTWSGIEGIEYWPRAFNTTDVPSTLSGPLTAGMTDTDNSLALFKSRAYYSLDGDLTSLAVNVRTIKSGDYGVSSQKSITKIDGNIVGVGELGLVVVQGGRLDAVGIGGVSPLIRTNYTLDLAKAVGVNDYLNTQYILSIPILYTSLVCGSPNSHITLAFNYASAKWTGLNIGTGVTPVRCDLTGGATIHDGSLFFVSRCGVTKDVNPTQITQTGLAIIQHSGCVVKRKDRILNAGYVYSDFGQAIKFRLFTSFDSLGEPSAQKLFQKVLIWRLPADYLVGDVSTAVEALSGTEQASIRSYMNWNTNPNSSNSKYAEITGIFGEFPFIELPIRDQQGRSIAVEIINDQLNQNIFISAIETVFSGVYSTESKRGAPGTRGITGGAGG